MRSIFIAALAIIGTLGSVPAHAQSWQIPAMRNDVHPSGDPMTSLAPGTL